LSIPTQPGVFLTTHKHITTTGSACSCPAPLHHAAPLFPPATPHRAALPHAMPAARGIVVRPSRLPYLPALPSLGLALIKCAMVLRPSPYPLGMSALVLLLVVLLPALVASFVALPRAHQQQQQRRHSSLRMMAAAPKVRSLPFFCFCAIAFLASIHRVLLAWMNLGMEMSLLLLPSSLPSTPPISPCLPPLV